MNKNFRFSLQVDDVFLLSNLSLKPAISDFNATTSTYELVLTKASNISYLPELHIKKHEFLTAISAIREMEDGSIVNVKGKVTEVSDLSPDYSATGEPTTKLSFRIKDDDENSVSLYFFCKEYSK